MALEGNSLATSPAAEEQSLRAALQYAVREICQLEETNHNKESNNDNDDENEDMLQPSTTKMSNKAMLALAELTYQYATLSLSNDLVAFSKHAQRRTITADDIKLVLRKYPSGQEQLDEALLRPSSSSSTNNNNNNNNTTSPSNAIPSLRKATAKRLSKGKQVISTATSKLKKGMTTEEMMECVLSSPSSSSSSTTTSDDEQQPPPASIKPWRGVVTNRRDEQSKANKTKDLPLRAKTLGLPVWTTTTPEDGDDDESDQDSAPKRTTTTKSLTLRKKPPTATKPKKDDDDSKSITIDFSRMQTSSSSSSDDQNDDEDDDDDSKPNKRKIGVVTTTTTAMYKHTDLENNNDSDSIINVASRLNKRCHEASKTQEIMANLSMDSALSSEHEFEDDENKNKIKRLPSANSRNTNNKIILDVSSEDDE